MRRRFMPHIVLLLLLFACASATTPTHFKPLWNKARQQEQTNKPIDACHTYYHIFKNCKSVYQSSYNKEMDDLSTIYRLEDMQRERAEYTNRILLKAIIVSVVMLAVLLTGFFILRKQNRKLRGIKEKLDKEKEEIEKSTKNKSFFLANMSHEIRSPLNALVGFSELIATEELDKESIITCQKSIEMNSILLSELICDVVEMSNTDSENMNFNIAPCDVVMLCNQIIQTMMLIKHTSATILFETNLEELIINTDSVRMQQIFFNLIVNATKYTKEGKIVLSLETRNDMAVFAVTDTGCGIPKKGQVNIFNRFEKIDEHIQGTGLGLSICKQIIEHLGGTIYIDPKYNGGARFVFTHPLRKGGRP